MKLMSIEAIRHVRSGGRVRYEGDKEIFLDPEPAGPTIAELIDQGYLTPPPTTEYRFARHLEPRFSVEAHLQLMRVVAIIGWAAAVLLALGV